jgi:hypothetical protein
MDPAAARRGLEAMYQTLRAGRWGSYIRSDVDLRILADRISRTMLQVGLDVVDTTPQRIGSRHCCAGS